MLRSWLTSWTSRVAEKTQEGAQDNARLAAGELAEQRREREDAERYVEDVVTRRRRGRAR